LPPKPPGFIIPAYGIDVAGDEAEDADGGSDDDEYVNAAVHVQAAAAAAAAAGAGGDADEEMDAEGGYTPDYADRNDDNVPAGGDADEEMGAEYGYSPDYGDRADDEVPAYSLYAQLQHAEHGDGDQGLLGIGEVTGDAAEQPPGELGDAYAADDDGASGGTRLKRPRMDFDDSDEEQPVPSPRSAAPAVPASSGLTRPQEEEEEEEEVGTPPRQLAASAASAVPAAPSRHTRPLMDFDDEWIAGACDGEEEEEEEEVGTSPHQLAASAASAVPAAPSAAIASETAAFFGSRLLSVGIIFKDSRPVQLFMSEDGAPVQYVISPNGKTEQLGLVTDGSKSDCEGDGGYWYSSIPQEGETDGQFAASLDGVAPGLRGFVGPSAMAALIDKLGFSLNLEQGDWCTLGFFCNYKVEKFGDRRGLWRVCADGKKQTASSKWWLLYSLNTPLSAGQDTPFRKLRVESNGRDSYTQALVSQLEVSPDSNLAMMVRSDGTPTVSRCMREVCLA